MFALRRSICVTARCIRQYSSDPHAKKMAIDDVLKQYRSDLMAAMRAKDVPRANVIRESMRKKMEAYARGDPADEQAITNEISNGRLAKPVKTYDSDLDILTLLRSLSSKRSASITQFAEAKRDDLVEKEQKELDVLREYEGKIRISSSEEIKEAVREVLALPGYEGGPGSLRKKLPDVLKMLDVKLKGLGMKSDIMGVINNMVEAEKKK